MRLNAAIALQGLSTSEFDAEDVIERIRCLLNDLEPDAYVGVELLAVGSDFGGRSQLTPVIDLIEKAEHLRHRLLRRFWLCRENFCLIHSLRLGHAVAAMDATKIACIIEETSEILQID